MTRSMTGFATLRGGLPGWSWVWDIRSVNGRGLDVRLRLPDLIDGLDQAVRAAVQKAVARGNVTVALRLTREACSQTAALDRAALDRAIAVLREVEDRAAQLDLTTRHPTPAEIAALPGVLAASAGEENTAEVRAALLAGLTEVIAAFEAARAEEGQALAGILTGQIDSISELVGDAARAAETRADAQAATLKANLAKVLAAAEGVDEARIAQELALLAVKSDITEELDRLAAHVTAARALLASEGPKGRKLDFLTQEFNREANTLCSKAGSAELTTIGLDLKTVIDQMREQVQNVE